MLTKIIDEYFIHKKFKKFPYELYKARALVYLHLISVGICLIIIFIHFCLGEPNQTPFSVFILSALVSSYLFKRLGSLVITANIISAVIFSVLYTTIYETGGIYSDDYIWMLLSPMIALLYGNRISCLFWLVLMAAVGFHTHHLDVTNVIDFKAQTRDFSASYFLVSYLMLAITIILFILIAEVMQIKFLNLLTRQNALLEKQQAELKAHRDSLELKSEQLEKMSLDLKRSNQDLEHFAYAASHDLKAPVRTIRSYLNLIQKKLDLSPENELQEFFQYANQGSERMDRLLNDLLSFSRAGNQEINRETVNLNNLILLVINYLSLEIQENKAQIIYRNLPSIIAPRSLLLTLLQNLISNAIKYQPLNQQAIIKIEVQEMENNWMFSIADNGIGIKKEDQNNIFEMFQRLHNQQHYEGSGIGLNTCKKIIQRLNGKIWLSSKVGKGTTFYFTLPKEQELPEQAPSSIPWTQSS